MDAVGDLFRRGCRSTCQNLIHRGGVIIDAIVYVTGNR
jgi:hypothetical protein